MLTRDERQQHRAVVGIPSGPLLALLLMQLPKLEVGPELTKPAVARIAEEGRTQHGAALVALPRQAQAFHQLAQDVGLARLPLERVAVAEAS